MIVHGRRNPFVASEGILPMLLMVVLAVVLGRYVSPWYSLLPAVLLGFMYLLFRDPTRDVPPVALGLVSPVDGEVVEVEKTDQCVVQGEAYRIRIRINSLGAYTARSPMEGQVMNLHSRSEGVGPDCPANALWVRNDEGNNMVMQFHGYRLGLAPRSFVRIGERIGQGHRCAYLRLAEFADVYLPIAGKVLVEPGQRVMAGADVIGMVPRP